MRSLIRLLLPLFFTCLLLVGFSLLLDSPLRAASQDVGRSPASSEASALMSPLMAPNDFTPATQEGRAAANTVKTYHVTLRNNGASSDTITLTTTSSQGWTVAVSPPTKTLASGAGISVTLTLTVPSETAGLIDTSVITATSGDNPAVQSSAEVTTQVGGVSLEADNTQAVAANSVYTYTHTLTNTGATTDTFALSLSSTQGWGTLVTSSPVTLAAGTTTTVQVRVTVPDNTSGETDTTTVTATSSNLAAIFDTAQDVTEVRGVSLEPNQTAAVAPNSVYTYTHTLTNTGAAADSFDLTSVSSQSWTTSVTPSSVPLAVGASATVEVRVEIPANTAGDIDITTVTATSSNLAAVTDTATDTTSVRGVSLAPDNSADVAALSVYTYTHTLTNTGAVADSFDLTSASSQGWTTSVTPSSVPLAAGASATVEVRVEIPANTAGDIDITTVTATSSNLAAVTETATDTTSVRGVSLAPDNSADVAALSVYTYTHTLTNTGAAADSFDLTSASSQGWTTSVTPSTVPLGAGASATVKVRVEIPANTAGDTDITTVTATSSNLAAVTETATDTTSVRGVSLAPDNSADVAALSVYTYTHTLTNTGAVADSFDLTSASSQGWTTSVTPSTVPLGAGASATVEVRVEIPANTAGDTDITTVTATSSNLAAVTDTATDTTSVRGVSLAPDNSQTVAADTVFTYTHTLTNTGALSDVFNLEINSSEGWATLATTSPVTLTAGATATIQVRVTVPSGAAGLSDTTVITATSANLAAVFDIATDITSVAGVSFAPNDAQSVDPGESYTYTHTLTNTGALQDSFSFTSSNTHGWAIAITPSSATLNANATATIQVRVTVPLSAAGALTNTTIVTATSGLIANLTGSVEDITTVNAIAGTRHAAVGGTNTNNSCLDSSSPCLNLTYAVSQALADDTIKLAAGTYTNTTAPMATVSQNLTIVGGYTSGNWTTSNPSTNVSILDGEEKGRVVEATTSGVTLNLSGLTIQRGTIGVYMQNAQLVMSDTSVISSTASGGSDAAIYLQDSDASQINNSRLADNSGHGLYSNSSVSVSLAGNTIDNNNTGVYFEDNNSQAVLSNNTISNNSGYGLYVDQSNNDLTVRGNTISGSTINDGVHLNKSNQRAKFTNNTITANKQDGVQFGRGNSNYEFEGNTITQNEAHGINLSAAFSPSQNGKLTGNTIANNSQDGIHVAVGGNGNEFNNNIIVGNGGDGIDWSTGSGTLLHNTIANNSGQAGVLVASAELDLVNTIIATHTYGIQTTAAAANVDASYSLLSGNMTDSDAFSGSTLNMTNNVTGQPNFVGGNDPFTAYHLLSTSAAIDGGTSTSLTTDIDGQGRAPDIGADEYPYVLTFTPSNQSQTTNPSTVISQSFTLRNSGGLTTTVALTYTATQNWSFILSPLTTTLGSGKEVNVTFTVTVPADGNGANVTLINATSTVSNSVEASARLVTLVGAGVELNPDYNQSLEPNNAVTYTHTITNVGDSTDSFALTFSSSQGWGTLMTSSPLTLAGGANTNVSVQITVPLTASAGLIDTTVVTATSISLPEAFDSVQNITTVSAAGGTRHVELTAGSDSNNNCLASGNPCATLNYAVSQAEDGDTIKIAQGTYTNTTAPLLTINKTLTLEGGYSTDEWNTSSPTTNPTILDGEGKGYVIEATTSNITATVNGLTIQGGTRGLSIENARLVMNDCIVTSNSSHAIYLSNSDTSQIQNCTLSDNSGYGLYSNSSLSVTLSSNTINNNSTGLYFDSDNDQATLSDNIINNNNSYGVYFNNINDDMVLSGNTISGTQTNHGIFFFKTNLSGRITNNTITANKLDGINIFRANSNFTLDGNTINQNQRYGINLSADAFPSENGTLTSNTIVENGQDGLRLLSGGDGHQFDNNIIANNGGYGIEWSTGSGALRHNTIADNQGGAGLRLIDGATVVLTNTIIANHTTGIQTTDADATVEANNTLWYGNSSTNDASGGGTITINTNVFGDPVFAGGSDPFYAYHIGSTSAAIDAGVDAAVTTDIDANSRPLVSGYDIGADEYTGTVLPPTSVSISGVTSGVLQNSYTFTATVSPLFATVPLTYVWQATGNSPVTQTNNLTDEVLFYWNSTGTKDISVTVFNEAGTVSSSNHTINLAAPPAASYPFSDDFESGSLDSVLGWTTIMTKQGRVQVSNQYPYSGTYGVLLDDSIQDLTYSTAALILTLDLSAQSDAVMEFWWREFDDENDAQDGVFISNDYGINWYQALSFNDGSSSYKQAFIDLAAQASANGISFNDHFQIKFQFYDNEPISGDGYAIDAIQIRSPQAMTQATITGETAGLINNSYPFTATIAPADATGPVTYTWQATDFSSVQQTGALEDSISFTWTSTGSKIITVTAQNAIGTVSDTHTIVITAEPDLQISTFEAPSSVYAGYTIPITYTIHNTGTGGTIATNWNDRVYLSTDNTLDTGTDTLLGTISHSGALAAGANYSSTTTVDLPENIVGNYYLFLVTDADNDVTEPSGEDNNTSSVAIHLALTISPSANGDDMVLNWLDISTETPTVAAYQIWRSTEPYFTPGDAGSSQLTSLTAPSTGYTDTTAAISDTATNHYYVIRAVDSGGALLEDSNGAGEFDFDLYETTGTDFTWIALPLNVSNLDMTSDLANHIESHSGGTITIQTISRWNAMAQSYDFYYHDFNFGDFAISAQTPYRLEVNVTSGSSLVWSQVGLVPEIRSYGYALQETAGTDFTWIMVPLDRTSLSTTSDLASDIQTNASGTVTIQTISRWNAPAQSLDIYYHQFNFGNFTLRPGYPVRIEIDVASGNSVSWPQ